MLADQAETQDNRIMEGYSLDDLNMESLKSYRNRFANLKPDHSWNAHDTKEFLVRIGAWAKNRETNVEGITVAGLLMFGEEWAITDSFPNYFLDYRERISDDPNVRWSDRITSQEGTWSGNLYDFYFKIIGKLTSNLNLPFHIKGDGLLRQKETVVHEAIREALVNTLVHTDYNGERGIVIEKEKVLYRFANPGNLRISMEQAKMGGVSDPRNKNLFKMFSLIGLGERAGSGIENIHKAWRSQHWRLPELTEELQPERTTLTLRTISLLPEESILYLKSILGVGFDELSNEEVLTLVTAHQEEYVTNIRLQSLTDKYTSEVNKVLSRLVEKEYLCQDGQGRGTKYRLGEIFISNDKDIKYQEIDLLNYADVKDINKLQIVNNPCNSNEDTVNNEEKSGTKEKNSGIDAERSGSNDRNSGINGERSGNNVGNSGISGERSGTNFDDGRKVINIIEELNLNELDIELWEISKLSREKERLSKEEMEKLILLLCENRYLTLKQLSKLLDRQTDSIRKGYVVHLTKKGKLKLKFPGQTNHPNQAYTATKNDNF